MSPPTKRMKLTKPTASIDDLPPEMICELFKHLSPKDLVICSMVNKRWQSIYAGFKVHRLLVVAYGDEHAKWRVEDQAELCSATVFNRLAEKPLLSNLKHLALRGPDGSDRPFFEFDLNELNRFTQLVHLEFNNHSFCSVIRRSPQVNWSLPKLRVLVWYGWNHMLPISIDCPELSVLTYHGEDADLLELKHPETIRKLETHMSGSKLSLFKNVECLLLSYEFELISKETLLSLPRLKELHYNNTISNYVEKCECEIGTIEYMKRELKEFVNDAKALRGSDFKFLFAGFDLMRLSVDAIDVGLKATEPSDEDDEDEYEEVYDEYIYLKNAHLITPDATLDFIYGLDETRVMSYVTGEIPACFLQKFELKSGRFVPKV